MGNYHQIDGLKGGQRKTKKSEQPKGNWRVHKV